MITVTNLLNVLRGHREAKVEHPLTAENALCMFGNRELRPKTKTLEEIFSEYTKNVLSRIKNASFGTTYLLLEYPIWMNDEYKEKVFIFLTNLQYTILYNNEDFYIVSWKKHKTTN